MSDLLEQMGELPQELATQARDACRSALRVLLGSLQSSTEEVIQKLSTLL